MLIHFTLTVPPDVAGDQHRLMPYVLALLPTTVTPELMTLNANLASGLTIEFDLSYPNLQDARQALSVFFANAAKIPDRPTP